MNLNRRPPGWSPEKQLWDSLDKLTQGLSWTNVPFDVNSEYRVPNNSRGAYLIAAAAPASGLERVGAYTVLYVGSVTGLSRSLRARFKDHLTRPADTLKRFRRCYWQSTDFWFTTVHDTKQIRELESLLTRAFNPPCNLIDPPGTSELLANISEGVPLTRLTHPSR